MKIPTHTRLSQIKNHLRPTLQSLGLRPRLWTSNDRYQHIVFQTKDRDAASPVQILVADPRGPGWEGCLLMRFRYKVFAVGDDGAKYFDGPYGNKEHILGSDAEDALARIKNEVLAGGVIFKDGHPQRVRNREMIGIYEEVRNHLSAWGKVTFICSRDADAERLKFVDSFGHDWTIDVERENATIALDEVPFAVLPSSEDVEIAEVIANHLLEFEIASCTKMD
ncbi:hypothetical protein [Rhizobium mongolense]|uniref:Uncharacterized protein n=2 Tax=Rhizobium mongolense TaxID=57676 RepID=A0ABR6IWP0_9HYPH|nr:hypothetical protein [Rhizobium mongolense]MBB4232195.1 hypothetical protein [Rhizobium mongolense]